ncbi:MAG: hypothetical protein AAGF11_38185 [Myxococcota bacterium]
MRRTLDERWLDHRIERELTVGLSPRRRARLHQRLRTDPRARARYDRAVCALRVLEGDTALAPFEIDLVGRWLAGDRAASEATRSAGGVTGRDEGTARSAQDVTGSSRRVWPAVLVAVVAALLVLWVSPLSDPNALRPWTEQWDEGWQARGGARDGLALEVLCGPADTPDPALRVRDCRHRDVMGFAYRVPAPVHGTLSLFGVDAQGDPMFYLPTPVDPAGRTVDPGHWRALRLAVRLSVNHAPGALRIYGLVAPRVATPDQVRTWVRQLAPQSPAAPGDAPWTSRIDRSSLRPLCPDPADCHAAELHLRLLP